MKCPRCGARSAVVDSRETEGVLVRRRYCRSCGSKWKTTEQAGLTPSSMLQAERDLRTVVKAVSKLARLRDEMTTTIDALSRQESKP